MLDHPGSSPSFPIRRIMSRARTPTFVGLLRGGLGFRSDRTMPASRVTLGSAAAVSPSLLAYRAQRNRLREIHVLDHVRGLGLVPGYDLGERDVIITRFLGRSYTEPAEMVQALSREHYEELGQRFMEVFARALPEVPQAELYWRFKLVVGVLTYILADTDRTGGYAEDLSDVDGTVRRLVAFLAAGLRAPVP
jgi:hypothetical protein